MNMDFWQPCMVCLTYSTWHSQSPYFLSSIILIISGGRYNLWRHKLRTFLQYPITFNHKSLPTDQLCSQTQSTVFPQCQRPSVTTTAIKIIRKQTHVYTSIVSFVKAGRIAKHYKAAVCISTNSFTLNFFTLQFLLLNPTPIHFQFHNPPHKTPNNIPAMSRFVWCDVPTVNLEYTIREET